MGDRAGAAEVTPLQHSHLIWIKAFVDTADIMLPTQKTEGVV